MSEDEKFKSQIKIVGINVLVLVIYTSALKLLNPSARGEDNLGVAIILALLIGIHVLICLILWASLNSKYWLLSALAVLLIGFSTCCLFMG
jgi:hypothetical protein